MSKMEFSFLKRTKKASIHNTCCFGQPHQLGGHICWGFWGCSRESIWLERGLWNPRSIFWADFFNSVIPAAFFANHGYSISARVKKKKETCHGVISLNESTLLLWFLAVPFLLLSESTILYLCQFIEMAQGIVISFCDFLPVPVCWCHGAISLKW